MSSLTPLAVGLRRISLFAMATLAALMLVGSVPTNAAPDAQTPSPTATASTPLKPILLTDPVPDPHQQEGVQWFAPTGHTLRGAFLSYWQQYGGLAQFGYPLTEEFFEPVGPNNKPVQVQYFERNRFELHPENAGTQYEVLLGTLGRDFRAQDPAAAQQQPAPALYFPETGHNLSGAFRQYWETRGGLFVHGYPITELTQEKNPTDGKEYSVQYFERSRFELHPENAGTPYEVLLGLLGRQLSEKKGYPYGWYPQYGRAADWSWVSGLWTAPYLSCYQCQCDVIRYIQNAPYFGIGTQVEPKGQTWENAVGRTVLGFTAQIVVHGLLFDIEPQVEPAPCFAPDYEINMVQLNPAQ